MKGQASLEYVVLLTGIILTILVIFSILYSKSSGFNGEFYNESGQYQILSSNFDINQSGILYGKVQFSKNINVSELNITFTSNNSLFTISFSAIGENTTYGYIVYLTENSTNTYSGYLYKKYTINYIRYSQNKKNYFISSNYTGYFN